MMRGPSKRKWSPPIHRSWVVKRDNVSAHWVRCCNVAPFEAIALGAGKGKVIWLSGSTMLTCNDVVNLMRKSCVGGMYQAVFAAFHGAGRNKVAELSGNLSHGFGYCSSRVEALALRRESMRSIAM